MNDTVSLITIRILAILSGLIILFCIISNELYPAITTKEYMQMLRLGSMIGFMGWLFTLVFTLQLTKKKKGTFFFKKKGD